MDCGVFFGNTALLNILDIAPGIFLPNQIESGRYKCSVSQFMDYRSSDFGFEFQSSKC